MTAVTASFTHAIRKNLVKGNCYWKSKWKWVFLAVIFLFQGAATYFDFYQIFVLESLSWVFFIWMKKLFILEVNKARQKLCSEILNEVKHKDARLTSIIFLLCFHCLIWIKLVYCTCVFITYEKQLFFTSVHRSSCSDPEVLYQKATLKIFAKFQGRNLR